MMSITIKNCIQNLFGYENYCRYLLQTVDYAQPINQISTELEDGTLYYWRVEAIDAEGIVIRNLYLPDAISSVYIESGIV